MSEESAHADRDIAIMKQLLKKQKQVGRAFVAANKSMSLKFTMITVVSKRMKSLILYWCPLGFSIQQNDMPL